MFNKKVEPFISYEEFCEALGSWRDFLNEFTSKPLFHKIYDYTKQKYESEKCYPPKNMIFNALRLCNLQDLKVVIVGQDPYHQPGQAMGLSFSVPRNCKVPPSLVNIFKAIKQDPKIDNFEVPKHGDLSNWAKQGVLLLNDVLTVTDSLPASHKLSKWNEFTDFVIKCINKEKSGIVFLLWGNPAQIKGKFIDQTRHKVLTSVHPSPLSASKGFLTCQHFSLTNDYFRQNGEKEIDWNLD